MRRTLCLSLLDESFFIFVSFSTLPSPESFVSITLGKMQLSEATSSARIG